LSHKTEFLLGISPTKFTNTVQHSASTDNQHKFCDLQQLLTKL